MPSGPHLAYWDSKDQALVNARGMQVGCPHTDSRHSFDCFHALEHLPLKYKYEELEALLRWMEEHHATGRTFFSKKALNAIRLPNIQRAIRALVSGCGHLVFQLYHEPNLGLGCAAGVQPLGTCG